MLMLTFRLDQNIDVAAQDVRDAIVSVLNRLPPGIDPPVVQKQDTDSSPIMTLAVSGPRDSRELYFLADRYVKNVDRIGPRRRPGDDRGRGRPGGSGQHRRARLAAYRTSIMQVRDALVAQNAEVPGGRVDAGFRELSLRTLGRVPDVARFQRPGRGDGRRRAGADQRPGRGRRRHQGRPHAGPARRQAGGRAAGAAAVGR